MQATRAEVRFDAMKVPRQAAVLVGGSLLLAIGFVMIFLPGPGVAVIFGGLALLATEYAWARKCLEKGKSVVEVVRVTVRSQVVRVLPRRRVQVAAVQQLAA